jgi:hypothetical protein
MDDEECLAILEDIEELSNGNPGPSGPLTAFKRGRRFGLTWLSDPSSPLFAIFDSTRTPDKWERFSSFRLYLEDISAVSFQNLPPYMVISRKDGGIPRVFRAKEDHFLTYAILIEQLLLNGVAVITGTCSMEFFLSLVPQDFVLPPIELQSHSLENVDQFWEAVSGLADRAYLYFDAHDLFGPDSLPGIALAARSSYASVLNQIANFFAGIPHPPGILDWDGQLTPDGRLRNEEEFKTAVYFNGLDPSILPDALPFILGLFEPSSTREERVLIRETFEREFECWKRQLDLLHPDQLKNDRQLVSDFRIIGVDVARCNRQHPLFETPSSRGSVVLGWLLKVYSLYEPRSYHQGMSDFLQPFVITFLSRENPSLAIAFLCFDAFLKRADLIKFLQDVNTASQAVVRRTNMILRKVAPIAWIWLKRARLRKLEWMHSDIALMYKRAFPNIWDFWVQIHCSPDPSNWLPYMTCAILLLSLSSLLELDDLSLPGLNDEFPNILKAISVDDVRRLSWWLYRMAPPEVAEEDLEHEVPEETEFFRPL